MLNSVVPIILLIGLGMMVAWRRLLPPEGIRHVSDLTFRVFIPVLLFATMSRTHVDELRWVIAFAYFAPTLVLFIGYMFWLRSKGKRWPETIVRGMGITYPNTMMLSLPVITMAYGQEGLTDLVPVLALNSLIMLAGPSVLIEYAAQGGGGRSLSRRIMLPLRRAVFHPFLMAIAAGLLWSMAGLDMPVPIERVLAMLASAASPLCLIVLGASLFQQFELSMVPASVSETALKLIVHPLIVWFAGVYIVGLDPMAVAVVTVAGATATGANPVLFAHRYQAAIGQISAVAASSTALGLLSLPVVLWLVAPI